MADANSTMELYGPTETLDSYGECGKQGTLSTGTTSSLQGTLYKSGNSTTGKGTVNGSVTKVTTTTVYSSGQVNIGGTWKEIQGVHTNIGGTWKNVSIDTGSKTEITYE